MTASTAPGKEGTAGREEERREHLGWKRGGRNSEEGAAMREKLGGNRNKEQRGGKRKGGKQLGGSSYEGTVGWKHLGRNS